MNHKWVLKIFKRIYIVLLLLIFYALNYASNDALVKMTLNLFYDVISVVFPIVPIEQFRNPYTF